MGERGGGGGFLFGYGSGTYGQLGHDGLELRRVQQAGIPKVFELRADGAEGAVRGGGVDAHFFVVVVVVVIAVVVGLGWVALWWMRKVWRGGIVGGWGFRWREGWNSCLVQSEAHVR